MVGRIALKMSTREVRKPPPPRRQAKLMHSHENPNRDIGQTSRRIAALQSGAGSLDDLAIPASGEAARAMLYSICSL
jgi:hypothetical protein